MFGVERVMRSTRSCPYQKFQRYPFYYSTTLHAETQLEIFRSPVAQRRISTFRRYYVNIDYLNRAKHELGARGAEKRVITFSRTGRSEKIAIYWFQCLFLLRKMCSLLSRLVAILSNSYCMQYVSP